MEKRSFYRNISIFGIEVTNLATHRNREIVYIGKILLYYDLYYLYKFLEIITVKTNM